MNIYFIIFDVIKIAFYERFEYLILAPTRMQSKR